MSNILYPLTFNPIVKNKLWGSELWMLSGVEDNETTVSNGKLNGDSVNELMEVFLDDFIGEKVFSQNPNIKQFPILDKLISSASWLSVQVHPNDEMAKSLGFANGKSEMWYIMDAEPNAHIIAGFNKKITPNEYLKHLKENTLESVLNPIPVNKGDIISIPAGLIHALGPGVLLAEIQQTSDLTYRIYDWNRVDEQGDPRELHTDLAIKAIDFDMHEVEMFSLPQNKDTEIPLFDFKWSKTKYLRISNMKSLNYNDRESFVILNFVEGKGEIIFQGDTLKYVKGSVVLIPATLNEFTIFPEEPSAFIETYI
ncbi:class I mannose-6-phosphate isomerase [Bacteroidales bacterium OttesenSCG-928-K22]|nr:class I mannose-6-phosphate isomerase [Bacteroidales bacterium OttesenSCG-928-K22]